MNDEIATVKCALCGKMNDGLMFCSDCAQRAQESIDRNPVNDAEAAVIIASDYLRWLYVGRSNEKTSDSTELVMLAVTVSHDLLLARDKISELQLEIDQLRSKPTMDGGVRLLDQDLALLVKP